MCFACVLCSHINKRTQYENPVLKKKLIYAGKVTCDFVLHFCTFLCSILNVLLYVIICFAYLSVSNEYLMNIEKGMYRISGSSLSNIHLFLISSCGSGSSCKLPYNERDIVLTYY